MLELDGGAGGGQLVRSALALSTLTETAFRLRDIRMTRPTPGLRPQHLAAVETAAALCGATVVGANVGSTAFSFEPGALRGGHHRVDIGTAGSLTLLFDTLVPLALGTGSRISVTATGGTDVRWAPPMAFFEQVKLPLLRRAGLNAAVDVTRRGFYPAGGGEATLTLAPSKLDPLALTDRGSVLGVRLDSVASTGLADARVAERQAHAALETLESAGVSVVEHTARYVDADSSGSVVVARLDFERSLAGASALGQRGTPAETVGERAAAAALSVVDEQAPVDRHLADQLLVVLALTGGSVRIPETTDHVRSSMRLLGRFGFDVALQTGPTLVARAP